MKKLFLILFIITFSTTSCDNNNFIGIDNPSATIDNSINDFVWKGMNSWYNWQENVTNLADSKDDNYDSYYEYINSYASPEELFQSLLFDTGNTDRFSWFVEDYVEQQLAFQGVSKSFGLKLQAVKINTDGDVIFYVRYVAPNSPASEAEIKRGAIFNAINGVLTTTSNYSSVIADLSEETVTLSFVTENNGVLTNVEDKTITAVELSENPVHYTKVFDNINGKKVGYLVYNGFRSSYNDELNAAFADFQNEGINELVLDLRLNGGGSVLTSAFLASMIYKNAGTDDFAELKFNSKHSDENKTYPFYNELTIFNIDGDITGSENINRLNTISEIYVLVSGSTASASEMIINGLKPFIPVTVIGTTTYGKNVGSITLYDDPDSDYLDVDSANSSHKNAMQPIVFQIYNKLGESNYYNGFTPDIEVVEYEYWNSILPFGDENEVVLKAALDAISGLSSKPILKAKNNNSIELLEFKNLDNKFEKEMYLDKHYFIRN
ncbi:S41 family peptidase [Lutibacter sp. TH_r2]|uniref:S41 family peptidase n=1 Tax=Lutibacter sp. TH_r2 TaxID=3082083 RepID=UPI002954DF5A|nr:S41 family peptidase [Lutibacter sp. TH_r2]MDV7188281.1 S41 family peptidase [Lutibacter sp. TH_r2]